MITAPAPFACAFIAFSTLVHSPRLTTTIAPSSEPGMETGLHPEPIPPAPSGTTSSTAVTGNSVDSFEFWPLTVPVGVSEMTTPGSVGCASSAATLRARSAVEGDETT